MSSHSSDEEGSTSHSSDGEETTSTTNSLGSESTGSGAPDTHSSLQNTAPGPAVVVPNPVIMPPNGVENAANNNNSLDIPVPGNPPSFAPGSRSSGHSSPIAEGHATPAATANNVGSPVMAPRPMASPRPSLDSNTGIGISGAAAAPSPTGAALGSRLISNNPNDERMEVVNADAIATPRASQQPPPLTVQQPPPAQASSPYQQQQPAAPMMVQQPMQAATPGTGEVGRILDNAPHDEAIVVSNSVSLVATPMAMRGGAGQAMRPDEDDDDDGEEEEENDDEDDDDDKDSDRDAVIHAPPSYAGQRLEPRDMPSMGAAPAATASEPSMEYNPAKYARANANASRELQDLFKHITDYQPFVAELPAKLRPFVPDYIPAIGDLDPFVKVPRPDSKPDGLGLYVVDEPTIPQSNPAVVLLELNATNVHGIAAQVVDSFENAANRPEVIDRWISDVKKVHYKKALPTVNYQRPMPDIEALLQVWPQEFEEMLNSDHAFPPPQIDLDLHQYIRTLCAILDIPTYNSLIDSLHVMFTLYEEFRSNQHFQHV